MRVCICQPPQNNAQRVGDVIQNAYIQIQQFAMLTFVTAHLYRHKIDLCIMNIFCDVSYTCTFLSSTCI